jgi:Flp pilus assembly secretin CpaC
MISAPASAEEPKNGVLTLAPGTSEILRTNPGARTIIIGQPAIVEANVVAEGVVSVTAKSAGRTNMILLDEKQTVILRTDVQVGASPRTIQVLGGDKVQNYSCTTNCVSAPTTSGSSVATASSSFRNCTEARTAGAVNIRRGENGYAANLDREGDGIACEE